MSVPPHIDGELDTSCSVSPVYKVDTNDKPVHIGAPAGMEDRRWSGLIDDVRLYNYALTPDEARGLLSPR